MMEAKKECKFATALRAKDELVPAGRKESNPENNLR